MDCGGGTCSRGVCICNDGFHRNGAGRCIALAPFPLKALLTACGAIVGIVTLCIVWKSCSDSSGSEGGRSRRGGKKSGKKKGFFYQLRKTIFPYKFVIVKAADKKRSIENAVATLKIKKTSERTKADVQETFDSDLSTKDFDALRDDEPEDEMPICPILPTERCAPPSAVTPDPPVTVHGVVGAVSRLMV